VTWLSAYPAVLVLPVIAVTGESVVLAAVIIATRSHWSLAEVALWGFVGTVLSDMLWSRLAGVTGNRLLEARTMGPRHCVRFPPEDGWGPGATVESRRTAASAPSRSRVTERRATAATTRRAARVWRTSRATRSETSGR
jgi:hypothetical protein